MSAKRVLIIDCVSPHEIERGLSTEGEILRSILANRNSDAGPKVVRIATAKTFKSLHATAKRDIRYLHVTAHANDSVLGFVDGGVSWEKVGGALKLLVSRLGTNERRVLCLSCCHSATAVDKLAPLLRGYFTGIYYLNREEVDFDQSITLWSMFYLKKHLENPHRGRFLRDRINDFIGEDEPLLLFKSVPEPKQTPRGRA